MVDIEGSGFCRLSFLVFSFHKLFRGIHGNCSRNGSLTALFHRGDRDICQLFVPVCCYHTNCRFCFRSVLPDPILHVKANVIYIPLIRLHSRHSCDDHFLFYISFVPIRQQFPAVFVCHLDLDHAVFCIIRKGKSAWNIVRASPHHPVDLNRGRRLSVVSPQKAVSGRIRNGNTCFFHRINAVIEKFDRYTVRFPGDEITCCPFLYLQYAAGRYRHGHECFVILVHCHEFCKILFRYFVVLLVRIIDIFVVILHRLIELGSIYYFCPCFYRQGRQRAVRIDYKAQVTVVVAASARHLHGIRHAAFRKIITRHVDLRFNVLVLRLCRRIGVFRYAFFQRLAALRPCHIDIVFV